jgi:hypothetical protein
LFLIKNQMGWEPICRFHSLRRNIVGVVMPAANQILRYQKYARECLRLAQRASTPEEKTLLLQMAEAWRLLAKQAEGRETKSNT